MVANASKTQVNKKNKLKRKVKIMEKKMTKKEMYTLIATLLASNENVVDFCNHEIELDRKSVV